MRYADVRQFSVWMEEERVIGYFNGRIVVLLNLYSQQQTYYLGHR